jgi:predicted small secreted protein
MRRVNIGTSRVTKARAIESHIIRRKLGETESPLRVVKDATEVEDDVRGYYMRVEKPQMA